MLFKNAVMYRFSDEFDVSTLNNCLMTKPFVDCRPLETSTIGFIPPAKHSRQLAYVLGDYILMCVKHQKKTISQKAVNQLLAQKVEELEEGEPGRKVLKHERMQIKQAIETEALPNALPVNDLVYGLICTRTGQLIVDTASIKKAEEFSAFLRKALGSLPVIPFQTRTCPAAGMKSWLTVGEPQHLFFADNVSLYEDIEKSAAKLKNVKIDSQAVHEHLSDGMCVAQMGLLHEPPQQHGLLIKFTVTDQLTLKKISVDVEIPDEEEDPALRFEADLLLSVETILSIQSALFSALGGVEGSSVMPKGLLALKYSV